MKNKIAIGSVVVGMFLVALSIFTINSTNASVSMEYGYKNITSANASSIAGVAVRSGFGTLGSIVINTTHATIIRVYDGTATSTGTLIASFPASAVVGTYTYDVSVSKGIVLDVPAGYAGNITVTSR